VIATSSAAVTSPSGWRGTATDCFAQYASEHPACTAIAAGSHTWTYGALNDRTDRLAARLIRAGIDVGDVVAIDLTRSASLVWAMLGVLKAGAAFTILDHRYPFDRLKEHLEIASPRALIQHDRAAVDVAWKHHVSGLGLTCLLNVSDNPDGGRDTEAAPCALPRLGPDDLAYIALTSGSSGTPKAIAGCHGSLSHFVAWYRQQLGINGSDRFTMLSGLGHDPLHRDVLMPLQIGAAVCVPGLSQQAHPFRTAQWLRETSATVINLTPALISIIAGGGARTMVPSLRLALIVGEVLTWPHVDKLRLMAPNATCVNLYGATETQQALAHFVIPNRPTYSRTQSAGECEVIPIGRGIDDVVVLIVRADDSVAEVGEVGEICFVSQYLSAGYLNDAALTASRFKPLRTVIGKGRTYRTGDFGRYREDANLEFVSRGDDQIKICGYRVHTATIEAMLAEHATVAQAVVVAERCDGESPQLVAFVTGAGERVPSADELRRHLKDRAPSYMWPSRFVIADRLPMTATGKLDRRALLAGNRVLDTSA
jgi:amino acid adenylation domain-containing protein